MHKIIKFNQKAWLKPYIDMNTDFWEKKTKIEKDIFRLMNNAVSGQAKENVRKHKSIKFVTP